MRKKSLINPLLSALIVFVSCLPLQAQGSIAANKAIENEPALGLAPLSSLAKRNPILLQDGQTTLNPYTSRLAGDPRTDAPVEGASKDRYWLLPDHATLQFAGSIGVGSLGMGYRNPSNTLEGELLLGYLPPAMGGDHFFTTALKGNWMPFVMFKDRKVQLYPLQTGLMAAYTFGSEFFSKQPDYYPKGYYPFSTAFHAYWQIGSRISVPMKTNRLEFYYELNASAEEIITLAQNPSFITPGKIFSLALGLKLNFEP